MQSTSPPNVVHMSKLRIGVDLGGSTLRIASFVGEQFTPSSNKRIPLSYPAVSFVVDAIVEECRQISAAATTDEPIPLGVGVAAMMVGDSGVVANAPNLGWRDVPLQAQLTAALAAIPGAQFRVVAENDVNAIAWGEYVSGAGAGARDVLTVYLGTGIGAGVVSNERLVRGSVCAGELGHTKIAWGNDALPCGCGSRGCIEAYAGGAALQARIRRELSDGASISTVASAGGIDRVTVAHVDDSAQSGDPWATSLWDEIATMLGVSIGNALAIVGSERVVFGGGVLSRTPLLVEQVTAAIWVAAPQAMLSRLSVVHAELGDQAGLVGAADLAMRASAAIVAT
jgi:glucokinase